MASEWKWEAGWILEAPFVKFYRIICQMRKIQTLFVSFLYHFFRRVVSLLMASKTAINLSSSSVTISDGIGLKKLKTNNKGD